MDVEEKFEPFTGMVLNVVDMSWNVQSNVHRYSTVDTGVCAPSRTCLTNKEYVA